MFKKTIIILIVAIGCFALGHWTGFKYGYTTQAENTINRINRYELSTKMAYSFVPLRSFLENDTENSINVLNNVLIASINGLTDAYDKNDAESAGEIIDIINQITVWRKENNITYKNESELDEALNEFNKKHNKSLNLIGADNAPPS